MNVSEMKLLACVEHCIPLLERMIKIEFPGTDTHRAAERELIVARAIIKKLSASEGECVGVWKQYQRMGQIEARPWTELDFGDTSISISEADWNRQSLLGGMVARNPENHADQWYIAPDYFTKNYAPLNAQ